MTANAEKYEPYNPYTQEIVFWDIEEYGDRVTDSERFDRATLALELVHCWDRIRDPVSYDRLHLMANHACLHLVRCFGETMKLRHHDALVLMEEVSKLTGPACLDRLMASAKGIERYGRTDLAKDHKSV